MSYISLSAPWDFALPDQYKKKPRGKNYFSSVHVSCPCLGSANFYIVLFVLWEMSWQPRIYSSYRISKTCFKRQDVHVFCTINRHNILNLYYKVDAIRNNSPFFCLLWMCRLELQQLLIISHKLQELSCLFSPFFLSKWKKSLSLTVHLLYIKGSIISI